MINRVKLVIIIVIQILLITSIEANIANINIAINISNNDETYSLYQKLNEIAQQNLIILKNNNQLYDSNYITYVITKQLLKVLESQGYYNSLVQSNITFHHNDNYTISFFITLLNRYTISKITILHDSKSNKDIDLSKIELDLAINSYAIAETILLSEETINKFLQENYCLLNNSITHEIIINHVTHSIEITFIVYAGNEVYIRDISFEGLKYTNPEYLKKIINIKAGQCLNQSKIEENKNLLYKSSLFNTIELIIPEKTANKSQIPIIFKMSEIKPRNIDFGIEYSTDLALGISAQWQHKTFFRNAEKILLGIDINKQKQLIKLELIKPIFLFKNTKLEANISLMQEKIDIPIIKEVKASTAIEKVLTNDWIINIATEYSFAYIKNSNEKIEDNLKYYSLFSLPCFITQDKRNNIVTPTQGYLLKYLFSPYFSFIIPESNFIKNTISAIFYFPFNTNANYLLALKTTLSFLSGTELSNIPNNHRLFSGGSRSIRGYNYQSIGISSEKDSLSGGKSLFEISTELRIKLNLYFQMIFFLDSGDVFKETTPVFKKPFKTGVGLGIQYFFFLSPIRVDFAIPINNPNNKFFLYFTIGEIY